MDTSCHQSSLGVISEFHAVCNTCAKCNYVLKCTSKLDPENIIAGVHTESLAHQYVLNFLGRIIVIRRSNYCSWVVADDFLSMRRSGNCDIFVIN